MCMNQRPLLPSTRLLLQTRRAQGTSPHRLFGRTWISFQRRSSSRLLTPSLRRGAAIQVAGGLYVGLHFAPTRPRDREPRPPVPVSLQGILDVPAAELQRYSGLSRQRANWVRLTLLISGLSSMKCGRRVHEALVCYPQQDSRHKGLAIAASRLSPKPPNRSPGPQYKFDCTFGVPGEGPWPPCSFALLLCILQYLSAHAVLVPRNAGDRARLTNRSPSGLPAGRFVLTKTGSNREGLAAAFSQWLLEVARISLTDLLSEKPLDSEKVAGFLVMYGRDLYGSGRPYWHFSETINCVTALRPSLRRQVQAAWDMAFSWQAEEPTVHHTVLLSITTICLLWGWTREAGLFALAFGGLLRIGEAVKAKRSDVVFPADALWSQDYVLIRLSEPKTKYRAARHQAAKIEATDLIRVATIAFFDLPKDAPLWPFSPQTLRKRLDTVLRKLGIFSSGPTARTIDLGSFRPGGATYLLRKTPNSSDGEDDGSQRV